MESSKQEAHRLKRRAQYHAYRRELIELGILSARGPGRPRLGLPEEALAKAKRQRQESRQRMRDHVRNELARIALEAS